MIVKSAMPIKHALNAHQGTTSIAMIRVPYVPRHWWGVEYVLVLIVWIVRPTTSSMGPLAHSATTI